MAYPAFLAPVILLGLLQADGWSLLVRQAQEDAELLRTAGVRENRSLIEFFHRRSPGGQDRRELETLVRHLGSESFEQREKASRELLVRGPAVLPLLEKARQDEDLEISRRASAVWEAIQQHDAAWRAAALRELVRRHPDGAADVVLLYAPAAADDEEEEILSALVALADACRADTAAALLKALRDPERARRRAAAYVLGRSSEAAHRQAVRGLLNDTDPATRLRACQGLILGRDKTALPALVALLEGPDESAWAAEDMLWRIAGDDGPNVMVSGAGPEAKRQRRTAWDAWLSERTDRLDLAGVPQRPPHYGRTIVAQVNANRVWEVDRTGQRRWTAEVSGGPIEAQQLPGGRLLIAQNVDNKVTERDRQGHILWELKVPDRTLSCQRLANGNTFVVTNSTVGEYRRDGTAVYEHNLARLKKPNRLNSGLRLRNGRIAVIAGPTLDEFDAAGTLVRSIPLSVSADCYGLAETPRGGYLVSGYGSGKVIELNADGKEIWSHALPGVFHATRLPNGNTLMSSYSEARVIEVTPAGKVVAEIKADGNIWRAHQY
jgi:outer membrane protein assembly factor BamB